jgi:hypothetical protein
MRKSSKKRAVEHLNVAQTGKPRKLEPDVFSDLAEVMGFERDKEVRREIEKVVSKRIRFCKWLTPDKEDLSSSLLVGFLTTQELVLMQQNPTQGWTRVVKMLRRMAKLDKRTTKLGKRKTILGSESTQIEFSVASVNDTFVSTLDSDGKCAWAKYLETTDETDAVEQTAVTQPAKPKTAVELAIETTARAEFFRKLLPDYLTRIANAWIYTKRKDHRRLKSWRPEDDTVPCHEDDMHQIHGPTIAQQEQLILNHAVEKYRGTLSQEDRLIFDGYLELARNPDLTKKAIAKMLNVPYDKLLKVIKEAEAGLLNLWRGVERSQNCHE